MGGGVTYRRANVPNFRQKSGLSKEIENSGALEQKRETEELGTSFFGRETVLGERDDKVGQRGAHTTWWRGHLLGRAGLWYGALWCPTGHPLVLPGASSKNRTNGIIFVNF